MAPLMLITDAGRVGEKRVLDAIRTGISAGLSFVQVRELTATDAEVAALCRRIQALGAPGPLRVVVNRRPELARDLGLFGVHVGGGVLDHVREARRLLSAAQVVGYSAHDEAEVVKAAEHGADYVTFSPIFGALSKVDSRPAVGTDRLKNVCARAPLPVFALGGVTPQNALSVKEAGAAGCAVIGAVLDAADAGAAVRGLLAPWQE